MGVLPTNLIKSELLFPSKEGELLIIPVPRDSYGHFINNVGCLRYSYLKGGYEVGEIERNTEGFWYDDFDKGKIEIIGLQSYVIKTMNEQYIGEIYNIIRHHKLVDISTNYLWMIRK